MPFGRYFDGFAGRWRAAGMGMGMEVCRGYMGRLSRG